MWGAEAQQVTGRPGRAPHRSWKASGPGGRQSQHSARQAGHRCTLWSSTEGLLHNTAPPHQLPCRAGATARKGRGATPCCQPGRDSPRPPPPGPPEPFSLFPASHLPLQKTSSEKQCERKMRSCSGCSCHVILTSEGATVILLHRHFDFSNCQNVLQNYNFNPGP